jgi:hypothetical protein
VEKVETKSAQIKSKKSSNQEQKIRLFWLHLFHKFTKGGKCGFKGGLTDPYKAVDLPVEGNH